MLGRQTDAIARIRAKISAGALPAVPPTMVWARSGSGSPCDACDRPIRDQEVEYAMDLGDRRAVRVHRACFRVWHGEHGRDARAWPSPASRRKRVARMLHAGELPSQAPVAADVAPDADAYAVCRACEDVLDRSRKVCVISGDADTPTTILCIQCFTAWLDVLRAAQLPAPSRGGLPS